MKQYGISNIKSISSENEYHLENLQLKGYTILKSVLDIDVCKKICDKAEAIYQLQKNEIGEENLKKIHEQDVVRMPFFYDEYFLQTITNKTIIEILKSIFKNQFILHLQNVIINRPNTEHHQTSWHRDLPYQEYVTSSPIAVNVFYCLSPFNEQTGATKILPYSHLNEYFPSIEFAEENSIYISAYPGDVIIFNSWLYHRASPNTSNIIRYGLNHVYTVPIIKQQIDIPKLLNGRYCNDNTLNSLLGYSFDVPTSIIEFRQKRLKKNN